MEIRRWAQRQLGFFRRFLPYARGVPSHNTLNDILNDIGGGLFDACITKWVPDDQLHIRLVLDESMQNCGVVASGRRRLISPTSFREQEAYLSTISSPRF